MTLKVNCEKTEQKSVEKRGKKVLGRKYTTRVFRARVQTRITVEQFRRDVHHEHFCVSAVARSNDISSLFTFWLVKRCLLYLREIYDKNTKMGKKGVIVCIFGYI